MKQFKILPRLIRLRDAANYLGMDRHRFNAEVRPVITEIKIGKRGIAFDRLDLDSWVEYYKQSNVNYFIVNPTKLAQAKQRIRFFYIINS